MNQQMKLELSNEMFELLKGDKKFNYYAKKIKEALDSGKYDELIMGVLSNGEKDDLTALLKIFINDSQNLFEINTLREARNYEEKRTKTINSVINLDDAENLSLNLLNGNSYETGCGSEIDFYKLFCIEYLYGIDLKTAFELQIEYGEETEQIDKNMRDFLNSLKKILQTNDIETLKRLKVQLSSLPTSTFDKIAIEDQLQFEYGKLYEGAIVHIDKNIQLYKGDEFGEAIVYDATQCPKGIISHLIGAASENGAKDIKDFYTYWNRDDFDKQQQTSCSFFSPINPKGRYTHILDKSVTFGFTGIENNILVMTATDGHVSTNEHGETIRNTTAGGHFCTPTTLAKKSKEWYQKSSHTEIAILPYEYTKNDEGKIEKRKKQPDYILVTKNKEGFLENIDLAKKAQMDFKNAGIELPIVFIDLEKWKDNQLVQENIESKPIIDRTDLTKKMGERSRVALEYLNTGKLNTQEKEEETLENQTLDKKIKKLQVIVERMLFTDGKQEIKIIESNLEEILKEFETLETTKQQKIIMFFNQIGIRAEDVTSDITERNVVLEKHKKKILEKINKEIEIKKFLAEQGIEEERGIDFNLRDARRLLILGKIQQDELIESAKAGKYDKDGEIELSDKFCKADEMIENVKKSLMQGIQTNGIAEEVKSILKMLGISEKELEINRIKFEINQNL